MCESRLMGATGEDERRLWWYACEDGVYFLLCKAKGSDGKTYNIRKDVNLLRGYYEGTDNE